ncbi:adenylate/guanylate cyclase domain-containing protein [Candidatus Ozemobacteraceae bacterium]|nr:adenylate/guanylate cyclase domain-containing protein [Candidatus Ozemobacteraceae bacterium]
MSQTVHAADQSAMETELRRLRLRVKLSGEIDAVIETCLREKKNLETTMKQVFSHLEKVLKPAAMFLQTQNEELIYTIYPHGITSGELEGSFSDLLSIGAKTMLRRGTNDWFVMPLDMAGEKIGTFGFAFPVGHGHADDEVFEWLEAAAEELDNYFFGIQESRYKHMTIMEIQRCMKSRRLNEAIDMAVSILSDMVPVDELVLLYIDEDLDGRKIVQYSIYRNYNKIFDSADKPMPELEELIKAGVDIVVPGNREIETVFPSAGSSETVLLDGLVVETLVGKMIIRPPAGCGLSVSSREIVQVFAETLRQRLVDFNREKNMLRQFFSPEVTRRLLRLEDYKEKYLSPRKADIGILFADISGFTKMSEQVLRDPQRIAKFIDTWSKAVVERVFPLNGALDKIVGDCVIILFGPPFYDAPAATVATNVVQAAIAIRTFTDEFLASPENRDIQQSPFYRDFGVAIGINYCSADVGLIGPNQDLTAFSSGMNNTARLQGLAKHGEILLTPSVKEQVEAAGTSPWSFSGPNSAPVKNVKEPLVYFKLEDGNA